MTTSVPETQYAFARVAARIIVIQEIKKCAQCSTGRKAKLRRGTSHLRLPRSDQKDLDDDDSSDDGYQPHMKRKSVNMQKKNDGISRDETPVNKRNEKKELGKSTPSVSDMIDSCRGRDPNAFAYLFAYRRPRNRRKPKWKQVCVGKQQQFTAHAVVCC